MVATILSATTVGFDGQIIEVECDTSKGLPSLQIVGLGNKAVDESKERVRSAIKNSHLDFPAKKITINLAPASIPKDGAHFDLAIALAIATAGGQLLPEATADKVFAGELSLDGTLRPIRGAIHLADTARQQGAKQIYVPIKNAAQASLISGIEVFGVKSLADLFLHLTGERLIPASHNTSTPKQTNRESSITIDDVHGQEQAKRALIIASAGHHNILLTGPPGTGKTMLARALMDLLPPLSDSERIEVIKMHSLANDSVGDNCDRPFRSPHHTSSHISLVGGGVRPLPGEMSLAHHGVLFLDELPEYSRSSLEAMRQPLEDRTVSISRAQAKVTYPANFMLVATQNPCPCGYLGDLQKECICSQQQILQYQKKISGPLLDRIDLVVSVGRIEHKQLLQQSKSNQSIETKQRIIQARHIQTTRYKSSTITNSSLNSKQIKKLFNLSQETTDLLEKASKQLDLSTRSYFKVLKVARSIADLEQAEQISPLHVSEALQYRVSH